MRRYIFIIIILSCFPLLALIPSGLPLTHDGADHVARIASFYQALSEGVVIPRWAENLNWGYGHPILMFLYPFSSYTASIVHFLGFSYVDSLKIIFGLGYMASGVTMFLWARKQFDEHIGVMAALFYLFAPYRFVDLYVRGAIGEHMAFIFPPLILYFTLKYFESKKHLQEYYNLVGIAVSFSLLLLSHNAISLMFVPLFAAYVVYLSYATKKYRNLLFTLLAFGGGVLISGFFTFPSFFEGKYTLRDIVTGDEYKTRFVTDPLKFLYSQWNYGITGQFSIQLGIAHLLGILFLPFVFLKKSIKKEVKILLVILFVFLIFSLFVQLPVSNFIYEFITTFKKFQFPWRFLSLSLFVMAILSSSLLLLIEKKRRMIAVFVLTSILLITTLPFWSAKGYIKKSDEIYKSAYFGTTDTGESAPIWSVRFMEKVPLAPMEVIMGDARIIKLQRTSTSHSYQVFVLSDKARILENTLYFPGWRVLVDGKEKEIEFQDPSERGLITFYLSKGEHMIETVFTDTKLRSLSNLTSFGALILIVCIGIVIKLKFKNEK
ncbi:MAG: 6-pyruvoyl-tetrahydropterin synthase-related protein [Candidatus Levybacteria bacterium]|nr:6-pyruvoyl-tetrahydropterin synthase-related protein [Candidatus Levybacteria bacterium]